MQVRVIFHEYVVLLHMCGLVACRSEVHMELDYSECEKSNAWQCFRDTENAAEFTAEALRTRQYDAPVTVLSVQSKSLVECLRNRVILGVHFHCTVA